MFSHKKSGYIVNVPYALTVFPNGTRIQHFLGVEIEGGYVRDYIEHGDGKLDYPHIISIRPYKGCPLDDSILKHPKFKNKPIKI